MVFENLTLFEVHLEDATFSPTQILGEGTDDERSAGGDDRSADEHEAPTDGAGVGRVLALVVASIVITVVVRKLVGDEEPEVDIDAPEEPVDVSIDD